MKKWPLLFLIVTGSLMTDFALAKDTITWFQPDFPPYVIVEGKEKTQGIDNQTVNFVVSKLPEYDHVFTVANYKRILEALKNGARAIVTPLFITPERQKYIEYSNVASYLALANGLAIRKNNLAKFKPFMSQDGLVDIEALIQSRKISIGVALGRSYSGVIDEMILKYKGFKSFYIRASPDHIGVLKMLDMGRFGAAFGFPVEVQYLSKKLVLEHELMVLPVEKMPPYSAVYFAGPKNDWGRTVISKINDIIKNKDVIDRFNGFYMQWIDEDSKNYYRKLKKQHYRE